MRCRVLLLLPALLALLAASARAQLACGDLDLDGDADADDALILREDLSGAALMSLGEALSCDVLTEPREPGLEPDPSDVAGTCSMADAVVMERNGTGRPPGISPVCAAASSADCCAAHAGIGCNVIETAACVCEIDPGCCTSGWSAACATLACTTGCAPVCSPGEQYCAGACKEGKPDGEVCGLACECTSGACSAAYVDADGDGFGSDAIPATSFCGPTPVGYATLGGDCNDAALAVNPGAAEQAGDELDQNCDGAELCYRDQDNDGFRTSSTLASADADCGDSGEARAVEPAGDCNDANLSVNPGAAELPGDEIDGNCDGLELCFQDQDDDGFRTSSTLGSADGDCGDSGEARAIEPAGDCNDANLSVNPGAAELTGDEIDQNCDGGEVCFQDQDDDSFRTSSTLGSADSDCGDSGEARAAEPAGDCNDANLAVNPGAAELAGDEFDQNCDGAELCYRDQDGDDFRTASTQFSADLDCADAGEARTSDPSGDCCDSDANARPGQTAYFGAPRACGGFDYNCDGAASLRYATAVSSLIACFGSPPLCTANEIGFRSPLPACGLSGTFQDCNTATCSTFTQSQPQTCR